MTIPISKMFHNYFAYMPSTNIPPIPHCLPSKTYKHIMLEYIKISLVYPSIQLPMRNTHPRLGQVIDYPTSAHLVFIDEVSVGFCPIVRLHDYM